MHRAILVAFLAAAPALRAQDVEIDDLVRRLGDDDFRTRTEASERLSGIGEPARAAIERAGRSPDPEVRRRAALLLAVFSRRVPIDALRIAARPGQLRLATMDLQGASLERVFAALGRGSGVEFSTCFLPPGHEVFDVRVESAPFQEVLESIGWQVGSVAVERSSFHDDHGRLTGYSRPMAPLDLLPRPADAPPLAAVPGAAFAFSRRPWPPDGPVEGWILEVDARPDLAGEIEWRVAAVRDADGAEVPFETCGEHSPDRVFVRRSGLETVSIRIEGLRRWILDVPIEIPDPKWDTERDVGGWEVRVDWPDLVVRAPRPTAPALLRHALEPSDVRCELSPRAARLGRGRNPGEPETIVVSLDEAEASRGESTPIWCGCLDEPRPAPVARALQASVRVAVGRPFAVHPVDALARIAFTFHLPVEEPFALDGPALPVR